MKRKVIRIDEQKCNGCGLCIPQCPEGALQIIDGKARLISEIFCDGLGACIGECPEGAISVEEREAQPYNERKAMENIIKGGRNVIKAHLRHLREHNQQEYLREAVEVLENRNIQIKEEETMKAHAFSGCPGSHQRSFESAEMGTPDNSTQGVSQTKQAVSALTHWPIQLHLISPEAPHFTGKDLLLSADCAAYTAGRFHSDFMKGKAVAIACPKLDEGQDEYLDKLVSLIEDARINTLTVVTMEVPCCSGLMQIAEKARSTASRNCPLKWVVLSIQGKLLREEWV
ncbi:MAG: ATP-binding protein [Spirochaetota bacterium]